MKQEGEFVAAQAAGAGALCGVPNGSVGRYYGPILRLAAKMPKVGHYRLVGRFWRFDKASRNTANEKRVLRSWSAAVKVHRGTPLDLGAERHQQFDQARFIVGILETDLRKAGDQVVTIDHERHM